MTPERWRRVEELYHAALARGESDRPAFLSSACAGDEALREEVESLLAQPASAEGFLAAPALEVAAPLVSNPGGSSVIGRRLGVYQVQALLGVGGMGEVYRARDTKLGRDVAIKVLPNVFASDSDRLARFEREARVLASLNHPHIGAIYGLEDVDGVPALVLELIDGVTLADRLAKGPLPVRDALTIAVQITDALEAAHEKGIAHRDLKPANVKITSDGTVKVLDFGLAKPAPVDSGAGVTQSPTVTVGGTREGAILGTAAYMSPEQARGNPVDKRTDIWAFGCVLFEMLTGRSAVAGDTVSDTIAAILEREAPWTMLPHSVPAVRRLMQRCLEKDPRRRLHDIADARIEIDEALTSPATASTDSVDRKSGSTVVRWVSALIVTAVITGFVVWNLKPGPSSATSIPGSTARLLIAPPPGDPLAVDVTAIALAPDGRYVAYVAGQGSRQRIFLRGIDEFNSTPIPGTEGGDNPFFSPDSQSVGFFANGKLKKVLRGGGMPVTVSEVLAQANSAPSWESDDTIFFTPNTGSSIWRLSASGGALTAVTTLTDNEISHRWPQLLPGGKTLLFSALTASANDPQAYVQSLETGQRRPVIKGAGARYLPTGHLVAVQAGTIVSVPFDPVRLETTGTPVAVLSGVMQVRRLRNATQTNLVPQVAFSSTGTMAYIPVNPRPRQKALTWVDRTGLEQPTGASGGDYFQPRVSPDGRRVAVTVLEGGGDHNDVWLYDLTRETWSRFTSEGDNAFPLWAPDGRTLTYVSNKAGPDNMYRKSLDGSGPEERLLASDRPNYPFSWSDGVLAFVATFPRTVQDIWVLRSDRPGKPAPFLETPFGEGAPTFSPDGRWLAYVSNESGRNEIHVRPFPGPGEEVTISAEGGNEPVWSRNGRELFYRRGDAMMAVDITTSPVLKVGKPRRLFEKPYELSSLFWPEYDVTPDGQRFMMVKRIDQDDAPAQINVVLNWFEELKRLVPIK
jgi:serine/threonine protein kinase